MRRIRLTLPLATCILTLGLGSCSRNKSGPENTETTREVPSSQSMRAIPGFRKTWGLHFMNQPGTVFRVQYSENTAIVDLKTVAQTLRGVSADHRIFLFQDSPALRQKLVPGKFVLFEGLDLRKVDALAVDGQTLIVGTETASLREALKSAQIQFEVPVDFKEIHDQIAAERNSLQAPPPRFALLNSLANLWDKLEPVAYADTGGGELEGETEFSDSNDTKWKLKFHNVFNPDHSADVNIQINRDDNKGINAEINAKAHLSRFIQKDAILMSDGQLQSASYQNVGLHGTVDFNWGIATSEAKTPMSEARVKLPYPLKIPLMETTDLPMSLEISEALLFHPAFTTSGEIAKGGFQVSYSGDEGFKIQGSNLEAPGNPQGDAKMTSNYAFSPLAAYGVVVAMAVPRVELRMGTEELFEAAGISQTVLDNAMEKLENAPLIGKWLNKKVGNPLAVEGAAYFQVVISTTAAHSGMQSLVPCEQFTMNVKGQVGLDAKWLGADMSSPAKDIFTKTENWRQPNAKICGGDD